LLDFAGFGGQQKDRRVNKDKKNWCDRLNEKAAMRRNGTEVPLSMYIDINYKEPSWNGEKAKRRKAEQ
jgi:hypothetical protein